MKIKYSIMSSDSNKTYLDFWPIVSKIWKKKFNVTPILYYIDENHDIEIDETYGIVKKMKPVNGIPVYLQCLWVRYWAFTQFLDDVCIISDIDMLPLSKKYFLDNIKDISEEKYVHINPCIESYGTLPSCYHICKGSLFTKILELNEDWEDSIKFLYDMKIGSNPGGHLNGNNEWFADERYSSKKIIQYKEKFNDDVIFLHREGGQNGYRIDRINWVYDKNKVKHDYYYDSHSIRPYHRYKTEIDELISYISYE